MRVNIDMLKRAAASAGYTQKRLAEELGVNQSTFSRKMRGGGISFSIAEMHDIVSSLSLTREQVCDIFLDNNSQ